MPRVNDGLQSLAELNKNPVGGFSAGLIDDNDLYRWCPWRPEEGTGSLKLEDQAAVSCHMQMLRTEPLQVYEGGVFKAYLIFPKDYPLWPPKMKFITDIWPPNGKLPLIWNKIKTGWSSLVPDTGKLSWPRQQSSVRHVDIDCFFVSGAIRNITDLKGKTVALSATMAQEGHLFIVVLTSNWGGSITKIKS
ncbi:uncharacterized protein LOC127687708 isoform X4 [Apodemus sylvaticus]|uniref:uncharacterized protein LOC127687708 isoform X4 n=1 Tax=Apodemus sylvaticus TaxID=10129 RepID=UPI00224374C7|nr:uncharacterized protein LOC127687708 isoform X4 [Apodemus sylvaticus]